MLGFFCAAAGAGVIAASTSMLAATQLARFQNFIYHSFALIVLFSNHLLSVSNDVSGWPAPHFLEVFKSCCALMSFVNRMISAKIVLNTKRWPKEQRDRRSATRNFTLRLESQ
jgi:hypothetical protein